MGSSGAILSGQKHFYANNERPLVVRALSQKTPSVLGGVQNALNPLESIEIKACPVWSLPKLWLGVKAAAKVSTCPCVLALW